MKPILLLLMIMVLGLPSCVSRKLQYAGVPFPSQPASGQAGIAQQTLDGITDLLESQFATTDMMILHEGRMIYSYGDIQEVSYLASCRKRVLRMLYGKYVEDGTIDLNQTIGSLGLSEDEGLLPIELSATVNDLMTSRSGVFYQPTNKGYDEEHILARGSVEPGTVFVYNNWDFNAGGFVFEQTCGRSIYEELETQLAIPLGFQDWHIKNQKKTSRKKSRYPAYHMYLSTRDMAKIGQLMLNEGAYTASGYGGQFITIIPKRKLVLTHKTKLPLLVLADMKAGGVNSPDYWELLHKLVAGPSN